MLGRLLNAALWTSLFGWLMVLYDYVERLLESRRRWRNVQFDEERGDE